jgi:hypothetical protein
MPTLDRLFPLSFRGLDFYNGGVSKSGAWFSGVVFNQNCLIVRLWLAGVPLTVTFESDMLPAGF